MNFVPKSEFEREVRQYASEFGGIVNVHVHGDRAYTRRDEFYSATGKSISQFGGLTLSEKQRLTWILHNSRAFEEESLLERMGKLLDESISFGVRELSTTVDVTYNTRLKSLEVAERLRDSYSDRIKVRIGAYNPSGFRKGDEHKERFELFEEAAERSDFLVGLAEKDKPEDHIGEAQHNWYILNLAYELKKPVQFHVGQENSPSDKTLELLLTNLEQFQEMQLRISPEDFPQVDAVHAISTSCLQRDEFDFLTGRMADRNVGLICCPRAAISMLQDSFVIAPIHNSIANIWRFAINGVQIRGFGTDNVDDIYIPASSADVYDEAEDVTNSLRFYNPRVIAKVLCGVSLDPFDIAGINKDLFGKV
ncbi:MAG: hypothetical protein KKC19_02980 [Nanoarchaeota archaeon]|nr:hypothetical protein [Nanoarchaeota archaeon]